MSRDTPMRLVIVSPYFPPEKTGCASRMSDMAGKLAGNGVEVTVLAPHATFPAGTHKRSWRWRRETTLGRVTVIHLLAWQPASRDPGFLSRIAYYLTFPIHAALWLLFNPKRYDAVLSTMPPVFTSIAGLTAKAVHRRKRFLVDVRDLWVDAAVSLGFVKERSLMTRATRKLEGASYRKAELVSVTTPTLKRRLMDRYGLPDDRIIIVPNGVDTDHFRPAGIPTRRHFVYTGILGHAQDLDTVLRALAEVRALGRDARVVIAGDGETRPELEALTQELDIGKHVDFLGMIPRENVPQLMSSAIAGLAPIRDDESLDYAVPTKAYEYLACGIPFIGTGGAEGEFQSLAKESGGGIVVPRNVDAMTAAMLRLIDHPAEAHAMGKRGRTYAVEHCDRGTIARRFLEHLDPTQVPIPFESRPLNAAPPTVGRRRGRGGLPRAARDADGSELNTPPRAAPRVVKDVKP